jgi:sulfide:quinone oxidoreductase
VVNVVENPIKCPVAPLEFLLLADDYFRKRGIRDRVELTYATPLPGAFTKPVASKLLGHLLEEREIRVEPEFSIMEVQPDAKKIVSYDEREVEYDLLVSVPLNMGDDVIARSGLGDELNYVPVDKHTFLSTKHANVFALGDASNVPASKAGSVAPSPSTPSARTSSTIPKAASSSRSSTATPIASSSRGAARRC